MALNSQEAVNNLMPEIRSSAKSVAKQWPDVVEADDLAQEIIMKIVLSSPDYAAEVWEMDRPARLSMYSKMGHQIAREIREDYYAFTGNYTYDADEVRHLLERDPHIFDGLSTSLTQSEVVDFQVGMERLKERNSEYWAAIVNYYQLNLPMDNSNSTERDRLSRARRALAREMNGARRAAEAEFGGR